MSDLECVRLYTAASASIADVITGETITWTEITDFVMFAQGVSARRGRAAEAESTSAGTLSFAVKTKPDGSRAPLAFGTAVRLGWDDGTQVHDVWLGSVAEIRQGWAGGVRGVQQVSCTDAVTALERVKLEAWPVQVAKSLGVGIDWLLPLDDDSNEVPPRDVSGSTRPPQLQARPVGVPADNTSLVMGQGTSPGSPAGDAESSVATFPAWYGGGWAWVDDAAPVGTADFTLSCYVKVSESNPTSGDMVAVSTRNWLGEAGLSFLDLGIDSEGKPYVEWTQGVTTERLEASAPISLNRWHHLALTCDESGVAFTDSRLWVDGTQVDAVADFDGPNPKGGLSIGASIESGKRAFNGQVSTVALFTDELTSTDIGKLAAVIGGYVGESTITRFSRLRTLTDTQVSGLISDTHRGTMGFQAIKGKSLASLFNDIATVEHAPWYVRRDGATALNSRASQYNIPAGDLLPENVQTGTDTLADTTGFVATNATLSSSTASAYRGTRSLLVTATDAVVSVFAGTSSASLSETSITAGAEYRASVWVRSAVATRQVAARINWRQSDGSTFSAITASVQGDSVALADGWQRVTVTGEAPADAVYASVQLVRGTDFTAGETFHTDGWHFARVGAADITLPASTVDPSTTITESVRGLANVLTVSRVGGGSTTLRDETSVAAYGEVPTSLTFAAGSDGEAETYGAAALVERAAPTLRTDSLTVDVTAGQASLTLLDVCRAEVGEVIEVTGLPDDAPETSLLFFVVGVNDRMSPTGWVRTFNVEPVPADTSAWLLGVSDDLDTDTRLGL